MEFLRKHNIEIGRDLVLRQHIQNTVGGFITGRPGQPIDHLLELLDTEPQIDRNGNLRYLVTAGLAVELITGLVREHHDLDLVIIDSEDSGKWESFGTDNVTPGNYWADMEFNPLFIQRTAAQVEVGGKIIYTIHPAILLVQKLSNAFGRVPRPKDLNDVVLLLNYMSENRLLKSWEAILFHSIKALPKKQQDITYNRLKSVL